MAKKLTAAQRTLIHPAIDMHEVAQPEPIERRQGPRVEKVVVYHNPNGIPHDQALSTHYAIRHTNGALCGAPGRFTSHPVTPKVCASCRAIAGKMRAVTR